MGKFCDIFYNILIYENGHISNEDLDEDIRYSKNRSFSILLENKFSLREPITTNIESSRITFSNLSYSVWQDDAWREHILLASELFTKKDKYGINGRDYTHYHIDILYNWCKEKYSFVI